MPKRANKKLRIDKHPRGPLLFCGGGDSGYAKVAADRLPEACDKLLLLRDTVTRGVTSRLSLGLDGSLRVTMADIF